MEKKEEQRNGKRGVQGEKKNNKKGKNEEEGGKILKMKMTKSFGRKTVFLGQTGKVESGQNPTKELVII